MKYSVAALLLSAALARAQPPQSTLPPLDAVVSFGGRQFKLQWVEVTQTAAPPLTMPSSPGPVSYAPVQAYQSSAPAIYSESLVYPASSYPMPGYTQYAPYQGFRPFGGTFRGVPTGGCANGQCGR